MVVVMKRWSGDEVLLRRLLCEWMERGKVSGGRRKYRKTGGRSLQSRITSNHQVGGKPESTSLGCLLSVRS